jgi:transcriptional regulator with XRE-family HTH domain
MKTKELLLECKIAAKVTSDYALAKVLNIPRQRISEYMAGKVTPDNFAMFKISMLLNRDPITVIAEIEAESEKNEKKKSFWVDFLQRAQKAAKTTTLALIFTCTLLGGVTTAGGGFRRLKSCA